MRITLLGTAAIGYPLIFCNCENCNLAKQHKGKSLRKRASILINDDLIIDLGPDTQSSMMMYDKDMGKIKYLLQTHIHTDHYDEELLSARMPYMVMKDHNELKILAHPTCLKIMSDRVNEYENADLISEEGSKKLKVKSKSINHGETIELDNYKIKAIETNHDTKHGSLLYVVSENDKNIFYATDTTPLTDTALEELKGIKLNAIFLDHTFGDVEYSFSHLNKYQFVEQIEKLKSIGCIDENTLIYGTHISHDGNSYHEAIDEDAKQHGYRIAYDGMELNI